MKFTRVLRPSVCLGDQLAGVPRGRSIPLVRGPRKIEDFVGFIEMLVWQKAHKLVLDVYKLTALFPKDEVYGLTSQIRRSALSVSGNIAEAFGRFHYLDKNKFYLNARGSLEETKNYLIISQDLGYLKVEDSEMLMVNVQSIIEELNAMVKTLRIRDQRKGRHDSK